ncbi:hypothetical protein ACHAXS_001311 [Conticribra weissflogii]
MAKLAQIIWLQEEEGLYNFGAMDNIHVLMTSCWNYANINGTTSQHNKFKECMYSRKRRLNRNTIQPNMISNVVFEANTHRIEPTLDQTKFISMMLKYMMIKMKINKCDLTEVGQGIVISLLQCDRTCTAAQIMWYYAFNSILTFEHN